MKDIKDFINISNLYTEVDLEKNKKVEEGFIDWVKEKLGIDDASSAKDLENLIGDLPAETKKTLDKAADDSPEVSSNSPEQPKTPAGQGGQSNLKGPAATSDAPVNTTAPEQPATPDGEQEPTATDLGANDTATQKPAAEKDEPVGKSFADIGQAMLDIKQLKVGDKVTIDDQEAIVTAGPAGNFYADANGKPIGSAATPPSATPRDGGNPGGTTTAVDPDANDPRGDQTNPPANQQGVDGPADAAAQQANTKDLMTRYNEGGKKAMPEIKKLQTELGRLGFDPNGIDGKYGRGTYAAVQAFQKANGLQVDGQAGADTLAAIKKAITGDGPGKGEAGAGDGAGPSKDDGGASVGADTADDGRTDAEKDAGAGQGGGADAMDPKNQQQDIDTAQPNADVDRYIELLNKLEGGQVNAGTPNATQGQVVASYDFRDLITLVESKLNEQLTQAEMAELKALHNKVQGHVGIPGMDDEKITNALNRYLKLVKEPEDAQTKASDAQLIAKGQAAKADAQNKASDAQLIAKAQAAEPKVSKELYVQMAPNKNASLGNFNVSQMKAKYPKPYLEIPNKDGTVTRGYGPLKNLEDFVANKGKKFKAKIIGKPVSPAATYNDKDGTNQQAGKPNAELDGAERGVQTASKDNNMKKAIKEASMNISINGESAAEVAELAGILKNAGMDTKIDMPLAPTHSNGHDDMMSKMAIVNEPEMDTPCGMDEEGVEEEWDNTPDESYADHQTMTHDLSGGINRQKKSYAAAQDGDNAMAVETSIREQLWAALNEKMTAEGRGRGKTLKASRGEKLNASRGNKLMASRGKDKKTTEGSRGKKSRGKKSRG